MMIGMIRMRHIATLSLCISTSASAATFSTNFDSQPVGSQLYNQAAILAPTFTWTQNFDGASLTSSTPGTNPLQTDVYGGTGSGFTAAQWNSAPAPTLLSDGSGQFLRLADNGTNRRNTIAFNRLTAAKVGTVDASFDFRITSGNPADGLGFVLLNTDSYTATGASPDYYGETPALGGSLGISFDV